MSTEAVLPTSTASPKEGPPKKKRKLSFPTAFTILFALTIVAVAATWFVPAGQYAKLAYNADAGTLQITSPQGAVSEEPATQETLDAIGVNIGIDQFTSGALSKPISVPNTYERLEQQPKGIADITVSMVSGTVEAADIMVFILVLGGLIGVVNASGAFESGLMALTKKTKGHEFLLVFLVSASWSSAEPRAVSKKRPSPSIPSSCLYSWRSATIPSSASAPFSWQVPWARRSPPSIRSRWSSPRTPRA